MRPRGTVWVREDHLAQGGGWPDINFEQARNGVATADGGLVVSKAAAKEIYYNYYVACYE